MSNQYGFRDPTAVDQQAWSTERARGMVGMGVGLQPERTPSLGMRIEQVQRRADGLIEAVEQFREHLEPVLLHEPPPGKKEGSVVSDPGSPMMQALDAIADRIDYAHQMINDLQRRAVI